MPKHKQRTRRITVTGEGPNGEDLVRIIDNETDQILKEEIIPPELTGRINLGEGEGPAIVAPKRLLSAQEMLSLAIRERQENLGNKIREFALIIQDRCRDVILDGKLKYQLSLDDPQLPSGEVISGAIKELRGLGYKAKQIPDPQNGSLDIYVSWPTKIKTKKASSNHPSPPTPEPEKLKTKKSRVVKKNLGEPDPDGEVFKIGAPVEGVKYPGKPRKVRR